MNLAYGQGRLKLEINILPQHISAKSKGGLIIEGGVSSSEYGTLNLQESQVSLECTKVIFSIKMSVHQSSLLVQSSDCKLPDS